MHRAYTSGLASTIIALLATGPGYGSAAQMSSPGSGSGPAAEVQRSYAALKANILKAADAMPPENYRYKPTPDIRTFARVVNHITEAQGRSCGAANGTPASAMTAVPPETAEKAAIVQALQASFAACDTAFAALTDANLPR